MQNAAPANVKLRRELGLFSAVSLIITVMIGEYGARLIVLTVHNF